MGNLTHTKDVEKYETPIMSMDEFKIGLLEKDRIPGLLIRSDENGYYNIGIQINDNDFKDLFTNNADYINEIVFNNKKNSYNFRRQLLNRVDFYFDTFNEFGHDNTNVDIILW